MVVIAARLRHIHVDGLAATLRPVVVFLDVLLDRFDSDRDSARLHEWLHVPHHVVLRRVQVKELAIDDAAMEGCAHALCVCLLRVDYEGACPELDIVKDVAGFDEPTSVHVFEDPNAVHSNNGPQAETYKRHSFAIREVRLE